MTRRVVDLRPRRRATPDVDRPATSRSKPFGVALRSCSDRLAGGAGRRLGALRAARARPAQRAERAGRGRGRPRARARRSRASPRRCAEFRGAERRFQHARRGRRASSSSTTTATTRPRSPRCSPPRARASAGGWSSSFQPHRYTRTRAAAARVRPGAGGRRRDRADRHLRGRRGADSRASRVEALAARGSSGRRRAGATSCRALDDVPGARWRARAPGDLGDHARRRIDRRVGDRNPGGARDAARERSGAMPVKAPADKRFRRAHVKPAGASDALRRALDAGARDLAARARWSSYARLSRRRPGRRARRALQVGAHHRQRQRAAVERRGAWRCSTACAAQHPDRPTSMRGGGGCWLRRGSRDAALRRVLPATRRVSCRERQPMGIGRIGGELYLIDAHGTVIDEYGPNYGEFDLPIIDGLAARRRRTRPAGRRGARGAGGARASPRSARTPDLAQRVSQIDVTDPHDAVVLLEGDTALVQLGDDSSSSGCRPISTWRRAARAGRGHRLRRPAFRRARVRPSRAGPSAGGRDRSRQRR